MSSMQSPPAKSSKASRYLFVFLLGLVIGVVALVMGLRAWEARQTWQDKWHDVLMGMNDVHSSRLGDKIKGNSCDDTDLTPDLRALRTLATDLEPAFPDLADDQRFKDHASKFRATLDTALAKPPLNCADAATMHENVGKACKACHQDFRS